MAHDMPSLSQPLVVEHFATAKCLPVADAADVAGAGGAGAACARAAGAAGGGTCAAAASAAASAASMRPSASATRSRTAAQTC